MFAWLCGITFFLIFAFAMLIKHEMGIRGFGQRTRKRDRMEEGE